jgi:hypothetical protein
MSVWRGSRNNVLMFSFTVFWAVDASRGVFGGSGIKRACAWCGSQVEVRYGCG